MKVVVILSLFVVGCISNPTNQALRNEDLPFGTRFIWQEQPANQPADSNSPIDVQPSAVRSDSQLVWSPPLYDGLEQRKEETAIPQSPKIVSSPNSEITKKETKSPKQLGTVEAILPTVLNEKRRLGDDDKADVAAEPVLTSKKTGGYVIAWPSAYPNFITNSHSQSSQVKPENKRVQASVHSTEKRIENVAYTPIVLIQGALQGSGHITSTNSPQIQFSSVPQVNQIPQILSIYGSVPIQNQNWSPIPVQTVGILQLGVINRPVTSVEDKPIEQPVRVENDAIEHPTVYVPPVNIGDKKVIANSPLDLQSNQFISWYPSLYAPQQNWGLPINYVQAPANCDNSGSQKQPQMASSFLVAPKPIATRPQFAFVVPQQAPAKLTPKINHAMPVKNPGHLLNVPISNWQSSVEHWSRLGSGTPALYYTTSDNIQPIQPVEQIVKDVENKWQHANPAPIIPENSPTIAEVKPTVVEKSQLYGSQTVNKSR